MAERTADEVAQIFSAAGDSVTLINADANFAAYGTRTSDSTTTETEWKEMIQRNVEHLELMKAKTDWGSESMTATTNALTAGKGYTAS